MIRLKAGVALQSPTELSFGIPLAISPVWAVALPIIAEQFEEFHSSCIITSAFDGVHKPGSLHYTGRALDFRIWHIPEEARARLIARLQDALGADFDVVLEKDHIHIEYDPKG